MAIVPLVHVTLIGDAQRRDSALLELQRLGFVHVNDLAEKSSQAMGTAELRDDLKTAISYLKRCPEQRPELSVAHSSESLAKLETDDADVRQITKEVLATEDESRALAEELESVNEKIEQTQPWGDFHAVPSDDLLGRKLFFYRLGERDLAEVPQDLSSTGCMTRINSDRQFQYWVVIANEPPKGMPCEPEQLDPRSLGELEARSKEIVVRREQLQIRRIALTRWLDRLKKELAEIEDETARLIAKQRTLVDGPVFVLAGWAPRQQLESLQNYARKNTLAIRSRKPDPEEEPPTLLSNPKPIAGAEGAVTFFMTPAYRSWDPTWVVFFSFAAFFAMILSDAGYGVVLGVILALFAKPLGRTVAGRRFRLYAIFMVTITIVYGLLIGSFFGFSPPEGSFLDSIVIKSNGQSILQDREAMMIVSATIGVFHLVLANLVTGWRWLGSLHALSSLGWAITLVGGWLMTLTMIPKPDLIGLVAGQMGASSDALRETTNTVGTWMLVIGLIQVVLFSSTQPSFSFQPKALLKRAMDGFLGLTNVTKAFGDALSYLRLFALGLASAQLALLFNQMASDASQVPGVGILLGLLVFLLGHTLNFVLAVVGGVVHGLRLNCIEFFSWSLTDEGQPFESFEMKANQ